MYTKKFSAIFTAVAILSTTNSVFAGTSTASLEVTATVVASCSISASPVAFGSYEPTKSTATNTTGNVKVNCIKDANPTITLDFGSNSGGTTNRFMKSGTGSEVLAYELYKPSGVGSGAACTNAVTDIWGSQKTTGFVLPTVTTTGEQTVNICGKIPPSQYVTAGAYTDTVIASVEF